MKLIHVLILLSFFVLIIQCDYSDTRLKIINNSKKEKILSFCIVGFNTCPHDFWVLNCDILDSSLNKRIFSSGDTLKVPLNGINTWEKLEKKDTVVLYVYDKLQFEQYCKGQLPFDSCYVKYANTKDDLIKLNWTIRINK